MIPRLNIFVGYDERQPISYTALHQSIIATSKRPFSITPLILDALPITRRGLTPFTFSRFLVPWLCDFSGMAIFMDADMLLVSDITDLGEDVDEDVAVSVVRSLEQYEQTSFMLMNCAHPAHRQLTPEFVQNTDINLHSLEWVSPDQIGSLDATWNQLVGYQEVDLTQGNIHYTMGVPAFPETSTSVGTEIWRKYAQRGMAAIPWNEIMGPSVHAVELNGKKFPKYVWDEATETVKPEHLAMVTKLLEG